MLNNTFATAKNLGVFTGDRRQSYTLSGVLTRRDRVDIFKLSVKPRASLSSGSGRYTIRGGSMTAAGYIENKELLGDRRVLISQSRLSPGQRPTAVNSGGENPTGSDLVFYFKYFKPSSNRVSYRIKITFAP